MTGPQSASLFDTLTARFALIEQHDLMDLSARYPDFEVQNLRLDMNRSTPSFFDELVEGFAKGRRGEVLLTIRHRDGRIWVHTKAFYPAGAYRLPTGGIGANEPALEAARREVWEEAGLHAEPSECAGILRYQLRRGERVIPFISYLFLFDGGTHAPAPHDAGERISDFTRISPSALLDMARDLRNVAPSRWQDWGHFRALAHDFLSQYLAS